MKMIARVCAGLGCVAALGFGTTAAARPVTDINDLRIQLRRFNDFPNTALASVENYPASWSVMESGFPTTGSGGLNQHIGSFSADGGATKYPFQNQDPFDISFDLNLNAGSVAPRKEAGFRFDSLIAGEAFFFVTSDGEVAAFGAFLPFFSFGGDAYTPGTTANMRMVYRPGAGGPGTSTMEYLFNGASSGQLPMTNTENGVITGTVDGLYIQAGADRANSAEFVSAVFSNFVVAVPAPASAMLIGMLGLAGLRRRR